ncbi:hypothetical protein BU26DRAFT_567118 [Trematosphaeria pertusa]|uniref:F-box domain-containing protein n=1 Tax=Trematosphaeria pertusa TaxID=390896 RepID=A0A6A6I899_9PLEO|nr:uncharacterized protein BU26DRAFT_567118 [Trematosphaeria pertusa]KAF2246775.1 hypothetical protein BU26DRAFT_567118 [Trematosphaeria pertusa]
MPEPALCRCGARSTSSQPFSATEAHPFSASTPYIPPEILASICAYLPDAELRSVRLASRACAGIAAKYLFHAIKFHASNASYDRLVSIAKNERLRRCVKSIFWDTNLWDLGVHSFQEWLDYIHCGGEFLRKHWSHETLEEMEQALPKPNTTEQTELDSWERRCDNFYYPVLEIKIATSYRRYVDQREDEEDMLLSGRLQPENLRVILRDFTALRAIGIINGCLRFRNGDIYVHSERGLWRGMRRHRKDLPDSFFDILSFQAALLAAPDLRAIEAHEIDWRAFQPDHYFSGLDHVVADSLTSLHLTFALFVEEEQDNAIDECDAALSKGLLKRFLTKFASLRTLYLDLNCRGNPPHNNAPGEVRHIFPPHRAWPRLENLTLKHVDSTEQDMIQLLSNHACSLKQLHLQDIYLDPKGSWINIVTTIQPLLTLDSASFSGDIYNQLGMTEGVDTHDDWDGWNMNDSKLAKALSDYLVHGGDCPIKHNNQAGVIKGVVQPIPE